MITLMQPGASLFASTCEALVNPVDVTGAQGAGLALEFKRRYTVAASLFRHAVEDHEVFIGRVYPCRSGRGPTARTIVFFPTKRHGSEDSRLEDVRAGLRDMVRRLREIDVRSVAIPALGCGLGGLPWDEVRPIIMAAAVDLDGPDRLIEVYPPHARPSGPKRQRGRGRVSLASGSAPRAIDGGGAYELPRSGRR